MDEFDLDSFVAFLREQEAESRDDNLDDERALAINFYNGEPFGDEEEGRSQLVTRDVAETIDYMTVAILDTMISGDRAVEFEHPDQKIAEQATAAITRDYRQGRAGYRFLHDWIKAGLLEKSSVAKVMVEEQPPKRVEAVVSEIEMSMLMDGGAQIAEASDNGDGTWTIAHLVPQPPLFREYVSPNEDTGFALDATDLDDDCGYLRFSCRRTLSDLSRLGFDVTDLASDTRFDSSGLAQARDGDRAMSWWSGDNRTGVNRKVEHHEEYSRYDVNGDGIAELVLSHRVGNQILRRDDTGELAIEIVDEHPGVSWCPFPMQHRIVGQSLADKVMDIQVGRSMLMRQAMDNLYQSNAPGMAVSETAIGVNTIDDLLTVRPGRIIRYKGAVAPAPITVPFVAQSAFEAMEVMAGEKESRTGITRLNQGLDADALNKTATGTALMQAQGQQMELYVARNFAEAFARLILKKYRLMREHGQPMELVIDGEVVSIDPRQWPDDMTVIARVGLGSGSKEQRLQHRMALLQITQEGVKSGLRIFSEQNIYNNIKGFIADANIGAVRDLLTDPDMLGPPQEKPDPQMLKAQADATIAAQKQDMAQQEAALKLQLQREEAEAKLQFMREEAAAKIELDRQKAAAEAELAVRQQDFEMQMAREQMALQREQAAHKADLDERAAVSKKRPGGDLDK